MVTEPGGVGCVRRYRPRVASPTPLPTAAPGDAPEVRRRPVWALPAVVIAVLAVAVAAVVGVRGLLADPVKSTDAAGVTTLEGAFEPFECGTPCVGYIQAGSRSVTVVLPQGCAEPGREQQVRVLGRLDRSQGKATYRATACPTPL